MKDNIPANVVELGPIWTRLLEPRRVAKTFCVKEKKNKFKLYILR